MDGKAGSLWRATAPSRNFDALRGDLEVDVAIVGAGITGLTAALLLAERGQRVVVLEKERVGSGETDNTTAHITVAIDARYHYLQRTYGAEEARLIAEASSAGLRKIADLVEHYGIDCRFERVPGYLYTEKRRFVSGVKNEAAAAKEAGLDAQWVTDVPLPFATRGAVLWPDQAQFHPGLYLSALAHNAVAAGARIFEQTQVVDVKNGEPCVVETERGRVRAKSVFMATNVPIAGFTQVFTKVAPYRSYAMAWRYEGDPPRGLFWDTADPYHYTRWQETNEGTFLIVGGADHRVGQVKETDECFEQLAAYTREMYGEYPLAYRWSGQIIEPHGGIPLIGGKDNVYISTGYAGQGMTFGTFGATLVSDLILGIENRWRDVFDPDRAHAHVTAREFITENLVFPRRLVADRLTRHDVDAKTFDDVRADEGKIIVVSGKKVAVYRDDGGTLHCVSPVCTHMKCDVAWNAAEKSWDCPCHGSRFTPDGEVLNGPARLPLEKME